MRITLINQFYTPDISATAHLAASLAEGLAGAGHQVRVVTSRGGYVGKAGAISDTGSNPRVYRVWTPQLGKKSILRRCLDYVSFYVLAAWHMVRLPAQDVVISLTTPPFIAWTGVLHRLIHRRTKLVLWNMDCYPDAAERAGVVKKGGIASSIMRAMNRSLFRQLDHLICLDEAMQTLLMSQYAPRKKLPVTIIPNWERAALFPPSCVERSPAAVQAMPELAGHFVILYAGNLGVGHPFETVVEAAKRLREKKVIFLFVGGGKRWAWLQETKQKEGLDSFHLHGYIPKEQLAAMMAVADASLITLSAQMLGVMSPSKLHGNLAAGLPIIYVGPETSNVDAALKRFPCGVSLREGDVEGLVRFIETAMGDAGAYGITKRAARVAFETAYCDTRTVPQFLGVLEGLFGRKEGAGRVGEDVVQI